MLGPQKAFHLPHFICSASTPRSKKYIYACLLIMISGLEWSTPAEQPPTWRPPAPLGPPQGGSNKFNLNEAENSIRSRSRSNHKLGTSQLKVFRHFGMLRSKFSSGYCGFIGGKLSEPSTNSAKRRPRQA